MLRGGGAPCFRMSFSLPALTSSGDTGLWVTNGTAAGTYELTGIVGAGTGYVGVGIVPRFVASNFALYNGEVWFAGFDTSGQDGLWETDGTAASTHELTGIAGASSTGLDPFWLTVYNREMLFAGDDASGDDGSG